VARRYGFQGGLVPGVTVYAYAGHAVLEALGTEWVERGRTRIRLVSPCYDGDEVAVSVSGGPVSGGPPSAVEFEVTVGERVCAAGSASLPTGSPGGRESGSIPSAEPPAPQDRPAASEQSLEPGRVLGSIPLPTDPPTAAAYVVKVGEPSTVFAERGIVHPGLLLEGANWVLMANVVLPAWLHVESDVHHRRPVSVGEELEVRARVAEVFERKGHRFVGLDVAWMAGPEMVAAAHHTAIWQLAAP